MDGTTQNFVAAAIMALASTLSGFGAGFLVGFAYGTDTKERRFTALIVGMGTGLVMMNALIWFGYHGFKYLG
jgi:cation transporter-like permease